MTSDEIHSTLRDRGLIPVGMQLGSVEVMQFKAIARAERERIIKVVSDELHKRRKMFDYYGKPTKKLNECCLSDLSITSQRLSELWQARERND